MDVYGFSIQLNSKLMIHICRCSYRSLNIGNGQKNIQRAS